MNPNNSLREAMFDIVLDEFTSPEVGEPEESVVWGTVDRLEALIQAERVKAKVEELVCLKVDIDAPASVIAAIDERLFQLQSDNNNLEGGSSG